MVFLAAEVALAEVAQVVAAPEAQALEMAAAQVQTLKCKKR